MLTYFLTGDINVRTGELEGIVFVYPNPRGLGGSGKPVNVGKLADIEALVLRLTRTTNSDSFEVQE